MCVCVYDKQLVIINLLITAIDAMRPLCYYYRITTQGHRSMNIMQLRTLYTERGIILCNMKKVVRYTLELEEQEDLHTTSAMAQKIIESNDLGIQTLPRVEILQVGLDGLPNEKLLLRTPVVIVDQEDIPFNILANTQPNLYHPIPPGLSESRLYQSISTFILRGMPRFKLASFQSELT